MVGSVWGVAFVSLIAGIDYSTHAVDVVLLDEDSDAATWHRFELHGRDAFERARDARRALHLPPAPSLWDDVLACGIEEPRGYGSGRLYRIQGAILACLPRTLLVQPWLPSEWRTAVGLPGNCPKEAVLAWVDLQRFKANIPTVTSKYVRHEPWPQDACDAYCIALATRNVLQHTEAA